MQVLTAGCYLGRFKLLHLIGKGGMGEVWLAQDSRLSRDVALKVLPLELASADLRIRFERESKLLAALNHPNIAQIYEAGEEVPQAPDTSRAEHPISFLVMEYIEGKSLSEILRNGPLSVLVTVRLGRQISKALAAAHKAGIIHRDLKPPNIMVTPKNQVKVLDFGLARPTPGSMISNAAVMQQEVTVSGMVMGTASYLSPEQIKGDLLDVRSDIWAFGCVLYQMLSGRTPFHADSIPEILATILRDEPPNMDQFAADVPRNLIELIDKCLKKDPGERPQTAQDISASLKALYHQLRGLPVDSIRVDGENLDVSRLSPAPETLVVVNRHLKAVNQTFPQIDSNKSGPKFIEVTHKAAKVGILVVPKPWSREDLVVFVAPIMKLQDPPNPSLFKKLLSFSNGHTDVARFAFDEDTRFLNLVCIQPSNFLAQELVQHTLDILGDTAMQIAKNLRKEYGLA